MGESGGGVWLNNEKRREEVCGSTMGKGGRSRYPGSGDRQEVAVKSGCARGGLAHRL